MPQSCSTRMKQNFSLTMKNDSPHELLIYDEIVDNNSPIPEYQYGISAEQFQAEMSKLGKKDEVNILVNSGGGSLSAGSVMYSTLMNHQGKKHGYIMGRCYSAATLPIMACDDVTIAPLAYIMIHNPLPFMFGMYSPDELRKYADTTEEARNPVIDIYANFTGNSKEQISQWMDAETTFNADDAVKHKFAHKKAPINQLNTPKLINCANPKFTLAMSTLFPKTKIFEEQLKIESDTPDLTSALGAEVDALLVERCLRLRANS